MLLADVPLQVAGPRDAVFDASRNLLYVTTGSGTLQRYDLISGSFLSPWAVGTSLNGADITPDGSALYVAESQLTPDNKGVLHRVDLATGVTTDITYAIYGYETGSLDVAIAADGKAYVTSDFLYSSYKGAILEVDTATGVTARSKTLTGEYHAVIARSAT